MRVLTLITMMCLTQAGPLDAGRQVAALRAELSSLITETGAAKAGRTERLEQLAGRAARAADAAREPAAKLEARLIQAQTYHAIAQEEIARDRASLASLRLVQLRSAANEARRIDAPDAVLRGDYWLLMADLTDTRRNARTLSEGQIGAIAQLERFLSMHADEAADAPIVRAVKLALMRVCNQAGDNGRAIELLNELHDPAGPTADETFLAVAANAQLVGRPLDPAVRRMVSGQWRLLVICDDPSAAPMREQAAALERAFANDEPKLTVALLPAKPGELSAGLPQGLSALLPRFVLVDPIGNIRAVGHTPTVAERLRDLSADLVGQASDEPIQ